MTRLALLDQAAFLRLRATGQGSVVQCTWVYDRDVDIDELRVFNGNLGAGLPGQYRVRRAGELERAGLAIPVASETDKIKVLADPPAVSTAAHERPVASKRRKSPRS